MPLNKVVGGKILLMLALLTGHSFAEPMPWQDPKYQAAEREAAKSKLRGVPLEQLTFIGFLGEIGDPDAWALVQLPNNGVDKIPLGAILGVNEGSLVSLGRTSVEIRDQVPICGTGKMVERTINVKLGESAPQGTSVYFKEMSGKYICSQEPNHSLKLDGPVGPPT